MSLPSAPRSDLVVIAVSGLVLVLVAFVAISREVTPPWDAAQAQVRDAAASRVSPERVASLESGVHQIWVEEIGLVDRCMTCHQTVDWGEAMATAPNPARSHPHPDLLRAHPIEVFGCTLCHGGQGAATTVAGAHGEVLHWEEPLLSTARAKSYDGLTRSELMEVRCNACHQHEAQVAGMPLLNKAKELVTRLKCARCHAIHGEGGTQAPDLTRVGEKHPSQLHFPDDWTGQRTALSWHIEHFLDPAALSPNSEMTKYPLDRKQATALALLVLSWRQLGLPAKWTPKGTR